MLVVLWSKTDVIGTADVPERWPGAMPDWIAWKGKLYYLRLPLGGGGDPGPGRIYLTYHERENPGDPYQLADDAVTLTSHE